MFATRNNRLCNTEGRLMCLGHSVPDSGVVVPAINGRKVFLSSTAWSPGGGLADADAHCQLDAQGILTGTFLALLAVDGQAALTRFDITGTPWVRVDGVALAPDALTLTTLDYPLAPFSILADGSILPTSDTNGHLAWFGAKLLSGLGIQTCTNWTSSDDGEKGDYGSALLATWHMFNWGSDGCSAAKRIVCFEI